MDDTSNNKAKLFAKMAKVMGDLTRIPKNGQNKEQNYSYVTSEDIKQAVRQAMATHNLCLFMEMTEYELSDITSSRGTKGTRLRGKLTFTIACGDTGETIERQIWGEAVDWQDKAFNKLYTTIEKYFLINTFLISTGDEDDIDKDAPEQITHQEKPQIKQQPKPAPQKLAGFPATVAEVNTELGKEHYTISHAQNTCKKLIDDFKMPGPNDNEALAGIKQILLDHANAPQGDEEVPF